MATVLSVCAKRVRLLASGILRWSLRLSGKGNEKIIAVFGLAPEHCEHAVRYVNRAAPDLPVYLFSTRPVNPGTAALCAKVFTHRSSVRLGLAAYTVLWRHWIALAVVTWTGTGGLAVKIAPFFMPPFRVLVMNEHRDFFGATPGSIARHIRRRLRDFGHRQWMLCLSVLSLWMSRPAWLAFKTLHGREHLEAPVSSTAGTDVVRFGFHHTSPDWKELKRIAADSKCRLILLAEDGAEEQIQDMLPLFEDPSTFAVSRQPGLRKWKTRFFARAPFRQLQPGEVCQVFAPVSKAILVDRAKMLALGIPETSYAGTAWLLLFWKAAAAGLRSFSIGGKASVRLMPDWPRQRAEFVTRVLSERALLRLGPREPELSSGNIARAITGARPMRGLPRVLVVSPYLPYPLSHGGAVRMYNLSRALSNRVDFLLVTFRESTDVIDYPRLHDVFREVYVIDRDEGRATRREWPAQVREHCSRSMSALAGKLCREKKVDLLQVEYTHMAGFRGAAPKVPAILVEHDVTFTLYRQLAEAGRRRANWKEYDRWRGFERRAFRDFDAVWTMSDADRETVVAEGSPRARIFVIPNGVDLDRFVPREDPSLHPEILYVGSFRHLPNVIGFEELRKRVMPRVWERCPDARLRVVAGPDPARYWRGEVDPRIHLDSFVEDLRPLYARAAVTVVPLLVSAGTNIKVMEALACGKPVVTTPVGCSGLELKDGTDALIRETSSGFAEAVAELLRNEALRARIAGRGRRTAEQRFGWPAIADRAYASYMAVSRGVTEGLGERSA